MLQMLRRRMYREEKGFTLIELLVVILIIGILAAIALPAFLGQRTKGQDSGAKSDARNSVSELESCYATQETYAGCTLAGTGLPVGTANGQVQVSGGDANGYVVTGYSESGDDFIITKTAAGSARTCTNANTNGGCGVDLAW